MIMRDSKIVRRNTSDNIYVLPGKGNLGENDGQLYMKATPSKAHQDICMYLSATIFAYIRSKGGSCKVYTAPFKVRLDTEDKDIEPDISVICDKGKLNKDGCHGAPDWVIEVVSPSHPKKDYKNIDRFYKGGVREYWIVDLDGDKVTVHMFEKNGLDNSEEYTFNSIVRVGIYNDLQIDFEEVKNYVNF